MASSSGRGPPLVPTPPAAVEEEGDEATGLLQPQQGHGHQSSTQPSGPVSSKRHRHTYNSKPHLPVNYCTMEDASSSSSSGSTPESLPASSGGRRGFFSQHKLSRVSSTQDFFRDASTTFRSTSGEKPIDFTSPSAIFQQLRLIAVPIAMSQYNLVLLPVLSLCFASYFASRYFSQAELARGAMAVMLTCVSVGSSIYLLGGFVFVGGISTATDVVISKLTSNIENREASDANARRQNRSSGDDVDDEEVEMRTTSATVEVGPNQEEERREETSAFHLSPLSQQQSIRRKALRAAFAGSYLSLISSALATVIVSIGCVVLWLTQGPKLVHILFIEALHGGVYTALCFTPLLLGAHALLPSLTKFFQYQQAIQKAAEELQRDHQNTGGSDAVETEGAGNRPKGKDDDDAANEGGGFLPACFARPRELLWHCASLSPIALSAFISIVSAPLFYSLFLTASVSTSFLDAPYWVERIFGFIPVGTEMRATMQMVAAVMLSQTCIAATETLLLLLLFSLTGPVTSSGVCMDHNGDEEAGESGGGDHDDDGWTTGSSRTRAIPLTHSQLLWRRYRSRWSLKHNFFPFCRVAAVTLAAFLAEAWVVETYMLLSPAMHCDPVLGGAFVMAMNLAFIFFPLIVGVANATATLVALVPSGPLQKLHIRAVLSVAGRVWFGMISFVVAFVLILGPAILEIMMLPSTNALAALMQHSGLGNIGHQLGGGFGGISGANGSGVSTPTTTAMGGEGHDQDHGMTFLFQGTLVPKHATTSSKALAYGLSCLPIAALFHVADSAQYIGQCVFRAMGWIRSLFLLNLVQWALGVPLSIALLAAACPDAPTTIANHILPALSKLPFGSFLLKEHLSTHRVALNDKTFNGGPDVAILGYLMPLLFVQIPCFLLLIALRLYRRAES